MENYCKNCGAHVKDNAQFCQECGKEVENVQNLCPNCGEQLDENAIFCPECGTKVGDETTEKLCPNCGESIEGSENFCENCGTNIVPQTNNNKKFIEQYKIPLIIIATVAIVVFTCVIVLSMTAHNNSDYASYDYGTQTVNLGNVRFEIPGDYRLGPTSIDYGYENHVSTYSQSYSNGDDTITLAVMYSPTANVDADSVVKQTGGGSQQTMMGQDGIYVEYDDGYGFNCGIDNKMVMVHVTSRYVLDQITVLG